MKKILYTCLLLLTCLPAKAQNDMFVESLMVRRQQLHCTDIIYNSSFLVPELYRAKKYDTLDALLEYNRRRCGQWTLQDFRILYAISKGTFTEGLYHRDPIVSRLKEYAEQLEYAHTTTDNASGDKAHSSYNDGTGDRSAQDTLNLFLQEMARSLLRKPGLSRTESFLVRYYAQPSDTLLAQAGDSTLNSTYLYTDYHEYRKGIQDRFGAVYAASSGIWLPTGPLNILGPHPYINLHLGVRVPRIYIGLTAGVRFTKAAHTYDILRKDSLHHTRQFTSYYLGADLHIALLSGKRHALELLTGIGYDGINTLSVDTDPDDEELSKRLTHTLHSLNLNPGIGYKLWFRSWFLGLDAKYNFLFYKNKGGTDLSGHAFTLGITIGALGSSSRHGYAYRPAGHLP